jgi:uncharacterized protein YlzI (FlbEa/FlbD family)
METAYMTKFVRLTESYNTQAKPLILNAACIRSIKLGDKGRDTMIQCDDIKYFFVKESVEEIWDKLNALG